MPRRLMLSALLIAGLVVSMLAEGAGEARGVAPATRALLAGARSWGYQLQNIEAGPLIKSDYDVLVIDAGTPAPLAQITKRDLERMKRKPDGSRRLVLAYMNIGEAEDYRFYWRKEWAKSPPAWMGSENCRWRGDHRVRFWSPEWQRLVFGSQESVLGRIVRAGFDGVFLDRVDINRFWLKERPTAYDDMVRFVGDLSKWAKSQAPGFLVVPQNGEDLLASAAYRDVIDGQAKEDLLFGDQGNDVRNSPERHQKALAFLLEGKKAGRPVFVIEYIKQGANLAAAKTEIDAHGFVPYFGPRSLSRLGIGGPEHPEDGTTEQIMGEGAALEEKCS